MIFNILYFVLAAFGLGFLVFIHELGHYFVARRCGMKVEAFGIGFGKPIYTFERDGVKWNICALPFGGYVRIAGMEKQGDLEPHQIPGGFFSKTPWERIKVALAGPIVNIIFAFFAFACIWFLGGRGKPFAEYTHLIGWVDPKSELYELGVRPGDEITDYGQHPFTGAYDLMTQSVIAGDKLEIKGYKVDYENHQKTPFGYTLNTYQDPRYFEQKLATVGVLYPANYLTYVDHPIVHPQVKESGIQDRDRILWIDGELVFSKAQLTNLVNQPQAFFTIQRDGQILHQHAPRVKLSDLRLTTDQKEELDDLRHEAGLGAKQSFYYIPYRINSSGIVEGPIAYLDDNSEEKLPDALSVGDQILAVDGMAVSSSLELLKNIQTRRVQIIVEREKSWAPISWENEDEKFYANVKWADLNKIVQNLGSVRQSGNLYLLNPITPIPQDEYPANRSQLRQTAELVKEQQKNIEKIDNSEKQAHALKVLEKRQKRLMLGFTFSDREVEYNPSPIALFADVVNQTWRTIKALFTGNLNPKWLSGPVGIVQVIHYGWSSGVKEALYWMAVISLNLGIINLMPIPVLDGGHICMAILEKFTKRPLKAKTMERLIVPFVVIIVGFFIYVTYNDILRLFQKFF